MHKTCSFKHENWMQLHNVGQMFLYQKRGCSQKEAVKIDGIQTTVSVQQEAAEAELMNRLSGQKQWDRRSALT